MCSFNSINGVPGCANKETETDILKKEWGFDGFIESDYTAVSETRACPQKNADGTPAPCGHGTAADGAEAGANALMAGTDSEMVSTHIRDNGEKLLAQKKITMSRLDDAVRRILRVKYRAGLFSEPLRRPGQGGRPEVVRDRRRPRRRPQGRRRARWCCSRTTRPTATGAAARPEEEDRGDRAAR